MLVMEFENEEQLQQCIERWKKILFLEDWHIKGELVEPPLLDRNGLELSGKNQFQIENQCGLISIVKPNEDMKDRVVKYCAECTLVHELLHCKYNWTYKESNSVEYAYYDILEHGLIEQMAKSLIMAKYNLSFSWFRTF